MKLLETDWSAFVACLAVWRRVPPAARLLFLTHLEPALSFPPAAASHALPFLLDAGILEAPQGRGAFRVAEGMRTFARILRVLHRYPLFDPSRPVGLAQYLADHFSFEERQALGGGNVGEAATVVGSKTWIDGFLAAPDLAVWESQHQHPRSPSYLLAPDAAEAARALVHDLARRGKPVEAAGLGEMECFRSADPDRARERMAAAVGGAIRYCLLFAALRSTDGEALLGVWPGLARTRKRKASPVAVVVPTQTFHTPLLVHDMSVVLVECSTSPLAVRRSDTGLPARVVERMGRHLNPLPTWCETFIAKTAAMRIRAAQGFLRAGGYVTVRAHPGKGAQMQVTEAGSEWLGLPTRDKLHDILAQLRQSGGPGPAMDYLPAAPQLLLLSGRLDLRQAVREVFRDLDVGRHRDYRSFLRGVLVRSNPYLELRRRGVRMSLRGLDGYREPDRKELEDQWLRLVERFLAQRLLVLDGVVVGMSAEGRPCFAMTEVGRFLLGYTDVFVYASETEARVVVQPNFEVVFLAANADAEAAFARFAERVGREVGTLFRLTKQSVLRAASSGLDADGLLAVLRAFGAGPLPANVEAEIVGWIGQCRRVRMESALLIRLPDPETTARALAAGGKLVRLVSDTVLEVVEPRRRVALERRLGEEGIFLEHGTRG